MRTAKKMYQYCLDNNYGEGFNASWGEKHFGIIEANLQADEEVLMTFIGIHNYISMSSHGGNCAYAITNKRVIIAQKKVLGEFTKLVLLSNLNDVTFSSGVLLGKIIFDTIKEVFSVSVNKERAKNIFDKVQQILFQTKKANVTVPAQASKVEELKGLKQLLDAGVLTQEEFEREKAKILKDE